MFYRFLAILAERESEAAFTFRPDMLNTYGWLRTLLFTLTITRAASLPSVIFAFAVCVILIIPTEAQMEKATDLFL